MKLYLETKLSIAAEAADAQSATPSGVGTFGLDRRQDAKISENSMYQAHRGESQAP